MLSILPLLLLGGLLPGVNGQNSDKEVLAHFATTGNCFIYVEGGDITKGSSPCKTWCPEHEGNEGMGVGSGLLLSLTRPQMTDCSITVPHARDRFRLDRSDAHQQG